MDLFGLAGLPLGDQLPTGWAPPSPMPGAMPCSRWSGSPARTISMRPTRRSTDCSKPEKRPARNETGSNGQMPPATAKNVPGALAAAQRYRGTVLSGEASATLRDQLLAELEGLKPRRIWTPGHSRAWPKANTLTPADGDKVRRAFQARLARPRRYRIRTSRPPNWTSRRRTTRPAPASTKACWPCPSPTAARQTAPTLCGETALPRLRP